jgi:hypothetical protein
MGADLAAFEAAVRRSSSRHTTAEPSRRTLPAPLTSLVGRENEAAAAARLLRREDVRLLTLIGPGGIGKTRLALEVAARVAGGSHAVFTDGVALVPLAPLRDPDLIPSVLAEALGIRDVADKTLDDALKRHRCPLSRITVPSVGQAVGTRAVRALRGLDATTTGRPARHVNPVGNLLSAGSSARPHQHEGHSPLP